jgi:excisionase family DNA binding protein
MITDDADLSEPDPDSTMPEWSAAEAAEYLGIPLPTLYSWNTRGVGPTRYRVGKRLLYRRSDVDEFIESRVITHRSEG